MTNPTTTAQAALQAEFYVGDLAQSVLDAAADMVAATARVVLNADTAVAHEVYRAACHVYLTRMAAWRVLVDEDSNEEALAIARHLAAAKAVAHVAPF